MEGEENNEGETVIVSNVYGDFCVRKARRKRQKALVREMFHDYANNTSLHGLSYTTKRGLTLIEKLFWLITFIVSLCLCAYLINDVWNKWKTSPVLVTVSEQLVSVGKVPFPSVTICPSLKSKATVYNYTAEMTKFRELLKQNESDILSYKNEFAKFEDVTHVCGSSLYLYEMESIFPRNISDADVVANMIEVAPKKEDIFHYCIWRGQFDFECEVTVTEVLTSEGLCYNINSLAADEILGENITKDYAYLKANTSTKNWSMAHGYSVLSSDVYPAPGKENGIDPDLQIILKDYIPDRDQVCNVLNSGFKVYVQHPADLPQSSRYYYAILNNQVSSMALSFSTLNTTESLKKYDPEIRQCYFPEDRKLKYFKIYTANNCRIECIANFTYRNCHCVGFYMPRTDDMPICNVQNTDCMTSVQENIVDRERINEEKCNCLPACHSIDYEAEILKTEFNLNKLINQANKIYDMSLTRNGTEFSKLEMYFKRPRFLSMRRSELFGLTDFLANIGGLLGLFLGFSFLSLVEIFYFVTLRLCCMLKKDLKEEKIQRTNTISIPKEKLKVRKMPTSDQKSSPRIATLSGTELPPTIDFIY